MTEVKLGSKVKDKVSGFTGLVVGRTTFLNGCTRISVQPKVGKDGKLPDQAWFDEPQLIVLKAPAPGLEGEHKTGGPMISIPTRNSVERRR